MLGLQFSCSSSCQLLLSSIPLPRHTQTRSGAIHGATNLLVAPPALPACLPARLPARRAWTRHGCSCRSGDERVRHGGGGCRHRTQGGGGVLWLQQYTHKHTKTALSRITWEYACFELFVLWFVSGVVRAMVFRPGRSVVFCTYKTTLRKYTCPPPPVPPIIPTLFLLGR